MTDDQVTNIAGCFGVTLLLIAALYYLVNSKIESISDDVSFLLGRNKAHGDNIERLERVVLPEKQHPPKMGPKPIGVIRADVARAATLNLEGINKKVVLDELERQREEVLAQMKALCGKMVGLSDNAACLLQSEFDELNDIYGKLHKVIDDVSEQIKQDKGFTVSPETAQVLKDAEKMKANYLALVAEEEADRINEVMKARQNMPIVDNSGNAIVSGSGEIDVVFSFTGGLVSGFNDSLINQVERIKDLTSGGIATGVSLGPSDWERTSTEFIAPLSKLKEIVCPPALMAEVSGLYIIPLTASCPPVLQIEDIKFTVGNYGQNN